MKHDITETVVWECLRPRLAESNKGSYGKALLCAGSSHYRGAAQLCTAGALRMGAGLVTLAATERVLGCVLPALPETICLPLVEAASGCISAENADTLRCAADDADALLFGCGLTRTPDTAALLRCVLSFGTCPLLLDADGLNLLSELPDVCFTGRTAVLTPHPGEMARLLHCTVNEVLAGPAGAAMTAAKEWDCIVVLKGHRTLIATPDGKLWQNTTGNAGLARGGSGDILAGMITGLLAQGVSPLDAALCGVWLHGAAADRCAARLGMQTMLPHDILVDLGALFAAQSR